MLTKRKCRCRWFTVVEVMGTSGLRGCNRYVCGGAQGQRPENFFFVGKRVLTYFQYLLFVFDYSCSQIVDPSIRRYSIFGYLADFNYSYIPS